MTIVSGASEALSSCAGVRYRGEAKHSATAVVPFCIDGGSRPSLRLLAVSVHDLISPYILRIATSMTATSSGQDLDRMTVQDVKQFKKQFPLETAPALVCMPLTRGR